MWLPRILSSVGLAKLTRTTSTIVIVVTGRSPNMEDTATKMALKMKCQLKVFGMRTEPRTARSISFDL